MLLLELALVKSATPSRLLVGLLGFGGLNVGAAMRLVLPGSLWRSAPPSADAELVRLEIEAQRRVRAGREATVRWTASDAERVASWRVLLDGRRVRSLPGSRTTLRKRVIQPGKHRWKVVAVAADGARIGAAVRAFRVTAAR